MCFLSSLMGVRLTMGMKYILNFLGGVVIRLSDNSIFLF